MIAFFNLLFNQVPLTKIIIRPPDEFVNCLRKNVAPARGIVGYNGNRGTVLCLI